jgi:hypothetical protein
METDIFKHIKIIIYEVFVCQNDKATHFYPEHIHDLYLFSDLIKRQMALSIYNEIEIDLFIVFPSPSQ